MAEDSEGGNILKLSYQISQDLLDDVMDVDDSSRPETRNEGDENFVSFEQIEALYHLTAEFRKGSFPLALCPDCSLLTLR